MLGGKPLASAGNPARQEESLHLVHNQANS